MTTIRKGQAPAKLGRNEFHLKFVQSFYDPAFDAVLEEIAKIEEIAWHNYADSHKAPRTVKAGPGYADPDYDLSIEWKEASDRLAAAEKHQKDPATRSRVLVIVSSPRNDGSCPGENSKSWRMSEMARQILESEDIEVDVLDLSRITSEYDLHIHPCKGCASTSMPLCHWPCSCYPNHSERQTGDWMNDIYEKWVAAHGVIIITPVHWYQTPTVLKAMIDRLVCADGGNPDPSSTHGKKATEAKEMELAGWDYPKHLANRAYGLVVHGDVAGVDGVRRALSDWMTWMGMVSAGTFGELNRYIGYYESYAESHDALDRDVDFQAEVKNVARAVAHTVADIRAGRVQAPDPRLKGPRPK
jgi:multimeric flavodoxin WrbA